MELERVGIRELEGEPAPSRDPGTVDLDRLTVGRHGGGRYGDWTHADGFRDGGLVSCGRSRTSE
jgi:hypothetical protein